LWQSRTGCPYVATPSSKVQSSFGEEDADEWFSRRTEKRRLSKQTVGTIDEEVQLAQTSHTSTVQQEDERASSIGSPAIENHTNWRASAAAQPVSFSGFGERPTSEWKALPSSTVVAAAPDAMDDSGKLGRPDRPACASDDPRSPLGCEEPAPFTHATFSATQLYAGFEPASASQPNPRESSGSGSVAEEAFCTPFLARKQPPSRVAARTVVSESAPARRTSHVRKTGYLRIGASGSLEALRAQPAPSVLSASCHIPVSVARQLACHVWVYCVRPD
jgi:hypothetical protein